MAAASVQESVIFSDSSPENIAYAKEFWKAIDGDFDTKSTLHVSGLNHRLPTAASSINRSKLENSTHPTGEGNLSEDVHPGLMKNSSEAERRQKDEEDEYINRDLHQKKQQQGLLNKRREERMKKEAIRGTTNATVVDEMFAYEDDEKGDSDSEAIEAMNEIDDFERMMKLVSEQKKEKKDPM